MFFVKFNLHVYHCYTCTQLKFHFCTPMTYHPEKKWHACHMPVPYTSNTSNVSVTAGCNILQGPRPTAWDQETFPYMQAKAFLMLTGLQILHPFSHQINTIPTDIPTKHVQLTLPPTHNTPLLHHAKDILYSSPSTIYVGPQTNPTASLLSFGPPPGLYVYTTQAVVHWSQIS